ncbi:MAG: GGDEF domain-containing protein [Oscillospiraceae bacterium]|jgi:diguanylate cyclase (GGDEF)-like protein|nr:GGDEF domain-containing protein [Oscillospiraceae bacterium]
MSPRTWFREKIDSLVSDEYLLGVEEHRWRSNLTFLMTFVLVLCLLMSPVYFFNHYTADLVAVLSTAGVSAFCLFLLHHLRRHEWPFYLFAVYLTFYSMFLMLFGAAAGFSVLWVLAYPLAVCFFLGNRFAQPYLTIQIASILILFSPLFDQWRTARYSLNFRLQFPIIFVAFSCLAMVVEHVHQRTGQKLIDMAKRFSASANQDQLTGLSNRRAFYDVIEREQARERRHRCGLQLIMCDIDWFKAINDRFGHQYGDRFLIHVAQLFKTSLRSEDYCFRWGGEEFLIVLPNTTVAGAVMVAERLRSAMTTTPLEDKHFGPISATMSFGIHTFNMAQSVDENVAQADHCLYRAKQNGRNRIEHDMAELLPAETVDS